MRVVIGCNVFTVEPTIKISELAAMVKKALGHGADQSMACLEISGNGLAASAALADCLPQPDMEEVIMSVRFITRGVCIHGSPYDEEHGGYQCGKC